MGASPVRAGDRLDDRETEPGAVPPAGGIGLAEALEGAPDEVGGEARAAILDVDRPSAVGLARADGDLPATVLDRVLNQVGERLLEAQPVPLDIQPVGRLD